MKWLKRILVFLVAAYLLVCGLLYFFQERMLFHPHPRPAEHVYAAGTEHWVDLPDGERLNVLSLPGDGRGAILYLHGNVGDNGRSLYQTRTLRDLGYDLWLVDYRGYGKSSGALRREEDLTEDVRVLYDELAETYGEAAIVVVGYSLGSGPASYLAATRKPAGLVLVAPFTSMTDMKDEFFPFVPDFLLRYKLDNRARLAASDCPVTILHGTGDRLIPFSMAERLAAVDPGRIQLIPLPGVRHRGAILNPALGEVAGDFLVVGE